MLGAAPMLRLCAIVFLVVMPSCALVHERSGATSPPVVEAGVMSADVGIVAPDVLLPTVDASTPPADDAGPITSCFVFWTSLPACPAVPTSAIGQPCTREGDTCGVHCCEPGPPIGCFGGRWMALEHTDNCNGVRCHGPDPCGAGQCAYGRVCMTPAGEVPSPTPQLCVLPPAPIDSCAAAPPGSIGRNGSSCTVCECGDAAGAVLITLDCQCC
jgi:hypothetical protein